MLLRCMAMALSFGAASAIAQDVNCVDPYTQYEMNVCAHQAYLRADQDLNLAYGMAMDVARGQDTHLRDGDVPAVTLLRDAQRAWISFRDKACELESTIARGGSMQPLIYSSCLERETRNRTEALRYFGEVN